MQRYYFLWKIIVILLKIPFIRGMDGQKEIKKQNVKKRQPLRLPFEKKEIDWGTWSYDHRIGICATLGTYLILAAFFASGTFRFDNGKTISSILVEFEKEEKDTELTPEQQRMLEQNQYYDFSDVRNLASNDNAELNSQLRDDRGTQASQIYEDAGKLSESMEANRALYEQGLALAEQIANRESGDEAGGDERRDTKVEGNVTVRFSFSNPVRSSVNLIVPAYLCEGSGSVELSVTLDINGNVTSASVNKSKSAPDECMQSFAVSTAKQSRFNVDRNAPAKHKGTITYIFRAQ